MEAPTRAQAGCRSAKRPVKKPILPNPISCWSRRGCFNSRQKGRWLLVQRLATRLPRATTCVVAPGLGMLEFRKTCFLSCVQEPFAEGAIHSKGKPVLSPREEAPTPLAQLFVVQLCAAIKAGLQRLDIAGHLLHRAVRGSSSAAPCTRGAAARALCSPRTPGFEAIQGSYAKA